jgi:hypothetical protein
MVNVIILKVNCLNYTTMRKKILDEIHTKAKKREIKRRPRMQMHGRTLKVQTAHVGKKLAK